METFIPDNLLAGDFKMVTGEVTILTGQNLVRGSVLGKVTASGKFVLCDPGAADGSQSPTHILLQDTDATAADAQGLVALSGDFNEEQITLGGAGTPDDVRDALRDLSIFLKKPSN